jgi:uncharacterized protein
MNTLRDTTEILDESACWDLLDRSSVGRLAVDVGGQPDIFPINFVVDHGSIMFRTAAGTKLAAAVLMRHVAFEIDGYEPDDRSAWSVVVKGVATEVQRLADLFAAEELPLYPWVASVKPSYVRIDAREVTGRRFHVADDVAPDASIGWAESSSVEPAVAPVPGAEYHPGAPSLRPD